MTVTELEDLSTTDLQQQWGKLKNDAKKMMEVTPIVEFCHVTRSELPYKKSGISDDVSDLQLQIKDILINAAEGSEADYYGNCKYSLGPENTADPINSELCNENLSLIILENLKRPLLMQIDSNLFYVKTLGKYLPVDIKKLQPKLLNFYEKNVKLSLSDCIKLCTETIFQKTDQWFEERKKRITGSICYQLYTYTENPKPDWNSKIDKCINSVFKGNANTLYGLKCEPVCITTYEKAFKCKVTKLGLVINPEMPWLGFSPDGFIHDKNTLIEIKCPTLGKEKTASEVVKKVPYLTGRIEDNNLRIKRKHPFYGQIQLGMGLFGCSKCHLVTFSTFDNTLVVVECTFDTDFFIKLYQRLSFVYFIHMLPILSK